MRIGSAAAFGRIILGEQFAQPSGLHAHHRVGRGIELGILAENVDGDRIALQALGFASLLAPDQIAAATRARVRIV